MNTTRLSVIAASAAAVAWASKSVAIWTAGGVNLSPLEGPLFLIGIVCFVIAVCALALSAVRRREWWAKGAAVAGAVVVVAAGVALSGIAVDALAPTDHWMWEEMTLWLPALALVAGSAWYASRRSLRTGLSS